jgi:hypothetical protein
MSHPKTLGAWKLEQVVIAQLRQCADVYVLSTHFVDECGGMTLDEICLS